MLSPFVKGKIQGLFKAFECFSSTFQGKFNFQGLFKTALYIQVLFNIVSEYDQEIPQSQTADNPVRKSRSTITRHQEDKLSKAISSLFPTKMIAILEWT